MKYLYLSVITLLLVSCGNKRILQLPEIENAPITEIHDVSHAYLFYDETKEDSVELNRKNIISTTNWLVNVDKRLTLAQAIPKIKFLQDKKRNAKMHKNESAKNYYTCNDTSIQNLGFLEFTDVVYSIDRNKKPIEENSKPFNENDFEPVTNFSIGPDIFQEVILYFESKNEVFGPPTVLRTDQIKKYFETLLNVGIAIKLEVSLVFNENLSFQEYITFKSIISELKSDIISINNNEFIY
ncbi:MAG: hypothetical protein V7719_08040 [Psychroserpens sp.]|uniref:hypothetical protein n=1 Tax=Psychroserpens sp. TaxID=2020870 RepID=UPI0030016969